MTGVVEEEATSLGDPVEENLGFLMVFILIGLAGVESQERSFGGEGVIFLNLENALSEGLSEGLETVGEVVRHQG